MKFLKCILILVIICSCVSEDSNLTAEKRSQEFKSKLDAEVFLKKYINKSLTIKNPEYFVNYHDNSGGMLSAPSDYFIVIVGTVSSKESQHWIGDLEMESFKIELPENLKQYKGKFNIQDKFINCYIQKDKKKKICYNKKENLLLAIYNS